MARFYGVDNPLALSWRRFKVLLRGLPAESAFFTTLRAKASAGVASGPTVFDLVDDAAGRQSPVKRNRVSIEQLMAR